jgi:hypothetical protein
MAYIPPNPGGASAAPKVVAVGASASQPAPPPQSVPAVTAPSPPAPAAQPSPAPQAAPVAQPSPAPQAAPVAQPTPAPQAAPVVQPTSVLLSGRDEEPSAESPLVYRERVFVVAEGTPPEQALVLARGELDALTRALADRPPGKFVNLAVFDHAWSGRPARPPLVTVQWKDWRGEPEVAFPLRDRAARASGPLAAAGGPSASVSPPVNAPAGPSSAQQPAPSVPPSPAGAPAAAPDLAAPRARVATPAPAAHDDRLAHAFEACQDLFFLQSSAEGLEFVVRLLGDTVPCEASAAALYDINTDEWRFVAVEGPGAEARKGEAVPARVGLSGLAGQSEQPLLVDAVESDARFDPGVDGRVDLQVRNLLLQGVFHEGRLLGLLQLVNRRGQPQFARADANVVTYVARQLGQFLHQQRTADRRLPRGTSVAPRRK